MRLISINVVDWELQSSEGNQPGTFAWSTPSGGDINSSCLVSVHLLEEQIEKHLNERGAPKAKIV